MDVTSAKHLKCVVVTPERAVLDEPAEFVALPMYDGELGVLPGRAPLIGRLGSGELRLQQRGAARRFFVDGGFAQVRSNTVTVLTPRAVKAEEVTAAKAAEASLQADAITGDDPVSRANRQKARQRALAMGRVAGRG